MRKMALKIRKKTRRPSRASSIDATAREADEVDFASSSDEYESMRMQNIKENAALLASLGMGDAAALSVKRLEDGQRQVQAGKGKGKARVQAEVEVSGKAIVKSYGQTRINISRTTHAKAQPRAYQSDSDEESQDERPPRSDREERPRRSQRTVNRKLSSDSESSRPVKRPRRGTETIKSYAERSPSSSPSVVSLTSSAPLQSPTASTSATTIDDADEEEDYETLRLKKIQENAALLASLGLTSASAKSTERMVAVQRDARQPQPPTRKKPSQARPPQRRISTVSTDTADSRLQSRDSPAIRRSNRKRMAPKRYGETDLSEEDDGERNGGATSARYRRSKRRHGSLDIFVVSDGEGEGEPSTRPSSRRDKGKTRAQSDSSDVTDSDDTGDSEDSSDEGFTNVSARLSRRNSARKGQAPLRRAERLGTRRYDPKVFGSIPSVEVGDWWPTRMACSTASVHAPTVAGISGNSIDGCYSICISGGYEDDEDLGETVTFTGSGGRLLKGTKAQPKNLRTAPQSFDQSFENPSNAALKRSCETREPIRVVRGFLGKQPYAPPQGYVYGGLYTVEDYWLQKGLSGFMVCKFKLRRSRGQPDLPRFDADEQQDIVDLTRSGRESSVDSVASDTSSIVCIGERILGSASASASATSSQVVDCSSSSATSSETQQVPLHDVCLAPPATPPRLLTPAPADEETTATREYMFEQEHFYDDHPYVELQPAEWWVDMTPTSADDALEALDVGRDASLEASLDATFDASPDASSDATFIVTPDCPLNAALDTPLNALLDLDGTSDVDAVEGLL